MSGPTRSGATSRKSTAILRPKSWNFELFQSEALYRLLDETLAKLGCAALVLPGGQALHVCPAGPIDLATLPQAAMLCMQYLQLKDGDAALVNDPFSGGTLLSEMTIVFGVTLDAEPGESQGGELLLARRLFFDVRIGDTDHLEQQGVRIPPTPLAQRGIVNNDLLTAISSHPLAPSDLSETITNALNGMKIVAEELKNLARDPGSEFKRSHLKRYLSDSSRTFQNLMSRLPLGTTIVSTQLVTGETIKLKLEVADQHLHFDFGGTDASTNVSLTEGACFGACIAATAMTIGQQIPFNAGSFEHIHVSTPAKTLLSGRSSEGLFSGMTYGVSVLCSLVQSAFSKLNPTLKIFAQDGTDGYYELRFAGHEKSDRRSGSVSGRIQPGTAARRDSRGFDAFGVWAAQNPEPRTTEEIERKWPVRFLHSGLRTGSGGKAKIPGGDGSLEVITVLEPCELRWSLGAQTERSEGTEAARPGSEAEIEIVRAANVARSAAVGDRTEDPTQLPSTAGPKAGKKKKAKAAGAELDADLNAAKPSKGSLPPDMVRESYKEARGRVCLFAGDQIYLYGAGGGGFGES